MPLGQEAPPQQALAGAELLARRSLLAAALLERLLRLLLLQLLRLLGTLHHHLPADARPLPTLPGLEDVTFGWVVGNLVRIVDRNKRREIGEGSRTLLVGCATSTGQGA